MGSAPEPSEVLLTFFDAPHFYTYTFVIVIIYNYLITLLHHTDPC